MATFEEVNLAQQVVQTLADMRQDMRRNAERYKVRVNLTAAQRAGATKEEIEAATSQNVRDEALGYLRRLRLIKNLFDVPPDRTKLLNGLTVLKLGTTEAQAIHDALLPPAIAQRDAARTTKAEIEAAADAILADVAEDTVLG